MKKNNVLTMKELPLSERPYELLEQYGPGHLTDAQLLAVLLKTGSKGEKVLDLATRILSELTNTEENPLVALTLMSLPDLKRFKGIGQVKALQIQALGELSRRISSQKAKKRFTADDPSSIAAVYMEEMRYLKQEIVKCIYLNHRNEILFDRTITTGSITRAVLTPREVFGPALQSGSTKIVILHNHPSGDPTPSSTDIKLTENLICCSAYMDVVLLDHVIIGNGCYHSMREKGNI